MHVTVAYAKSIYFLNMDGPDRSSLEMERNAQLVNSELLIKNKQFFL